jgi:hypothetical protein
VNIGYLIQLRDQQIENQEVLGVIAAIAVGQTIQEQREQVQALEREIEALKRTIAILRPQGDLNLNEAEQQLLLERLQRSPHLRQEELQSLQERLDQLSIREIQNQQSPRRSSIGTNSSGSYHTPEVASQGSPCPPDSEESEENEVPIPIPEPYAIPGVSTEEIEVFDEIHTGPALREWEIQQAIDFDRQYGFDEDGLFERENIREELQALRHREEDAEQNRRDTLEEDSGPPAPTHHLGRRFESDAYDVSLDNSFLRAHCDEYSYDYDYNQCDDFD